MPNTSNLVLGRLYETGSPLKTIVDVCGDSDESESMLRYAVDHDRNLHKLLEDYDHIWVAATQSTLRYAIRRPDTLRRSQGSWVEYTATSRSVSIHISQPGPPRVCLVKLMTYNSVAHTEETIGSSLPHTRADGALMSSVRREHTKMRLDRRSVFADFVEHLCCACTGIIHASETLTFICWRP